MIHVHMAVTSIYGYLTEVLIVHSGNATDATIVVRRSHICYIIPIQVHQGQFTRELLKTTSEPAVEFSTTVFFNTFCRNWDWVIFQSRTDRR